MKTKEKSLIGISVTLVAAALLLLAVAPALGMHPIDPPGQGPAITNQTDIQIEAGHFTLDEEYKMDYVSSTVIEYGVDEEVLYEAPANAAKIRYKDEIRAIDGSLRLVKDFASNLQADDKPNVGVVTDIGYTRFDESIGLLSREEKGGVAVFNAPTVFYEYLEGQEEAPDVLCVYADDKLFTAAAGSALQMLAVDTHSGTQLDVTNSISVVHSIGASGVGTVSAGMELVNIEGSEVATGLCDLPPRQPLQLAIFSEHTSATGIFNFSKGMSAAIDDQRFPSPWAEFACPWPPCP